MPKKGKTTRKKQPNVMLTSSDAKQEDDIAQDIKSPHMRIV